MKNSTGTAAPRADETVAQLCRAAQAEAAEKLMILDSVIVANMPVAASIAQRYRARGIAQDDLVQVANAALVRVVHAYDPETGGDLLSYAVPSIRGEIRRYFRDNGWMVRPPRRIQELQSQVIAARDRLGDEQGGAAPEVIAEELDASVAEVEEALSAQGCFRPLSLDAPVGDGEFPLGSLLEAPATGDSAAAEARAVLAPVVRRLAKADRELIGLRFFEGLTQRQIAARLGLTQTYVSRRLNRVLATLRSQIVGPRLEASTVGGAS